MQRDPVKLLVLNNSQPWQVPQGPYDKIIEPFIPIVENSGGEIEAQMGILDFELSTSLGDSLIELRFNGEPVASAAIVWEQLGASAAWQYVMSHHAEVSPEADPVAPAELDRLPLLVISFDHDFFRGANEEVLSEAVTAIWSVSLAIRNFHERCLANN